MKKPRYFRGSLRMEPRGIEPRFAVCDSAVIPLDHGPGGCICCTTCAGTDRNAINQSDIQRPGASCASYPAQPYRQDYLPAGGVPNGRLKAMDPVADQTFNRRVKPVIEREINRIRYMFTKLLQAVDRPGFLTL